jgi:arsenate reductase
VAVLKTIKIYEYKNCTTCQKASKFLQSQGFEFERVPIVDQPPSIAELNLVLKSIKERGGSFKNLFNTSGQLYRQLEVSEKIKNGMSEVEAIGLLSLNGKLIKRPFLIVGSAGTVGFKTSEWAQLL